MITFGGLSDLSRAAAEPIDMINAGVTEEHLYSACCDL